jgi:hypothetical protein
MAESLKVTPGDKVAIRTGVGDSYAILMVLRTGRFIEVSNGRRYRLDGTPTGTNHNLSPIVPVTEEILRIVEKNSLVAKLSAINYNDWKKMNLEQLQAIVKIVESNNSGN